MACVACAWRAWLECPERGPGHGSFTGPEPPEPRVPSERPGARNDRLHSTSTLTTLHAGLEHLACARSTQRIPLRMLHTSPSLSLGADPPRQLVINCNSRHCDVRSVTSLHRNTCCSCSSTERAQDASDAGQDKVALESDDAPLARTLHWSKALAYSL